MKQTQIIMGMPVTVEIIDETSGQEMAAVFDYFREVDARYSTYKPESEISQINNGLPREAWSAEMAGVLKLCEETKRETNGYFDIVRADGTRDPSGLVKGWAIRNAADMLRSRNVRNFYIEAGGDIEACGHNAAGGPWAVGIRSPFDTDEIIKVVYLQDAAIATSGTYIRGEHIYNPHANHVSAHGVCSLSVISPNIYDADRFATAAFAMGKQGIMFIESLPNTEGYMVDDTKTATYTSGFAGYAKA